MPDDHGTRRQYRQGCHCTPCRAANAAYEAKRRHAHRCGLPLLGAIVKPTEARRRIHQLEAEHVPIAQRLGLKCGRLRLHPDGVTVRRVLQLRWLCREYLVGEPLEPNEQNP